MVFGLDFWKKTLIDMGYEVVEKRLDVETLVKQKVVKESYKLHDAVMLYRDSYVEAAVLVFDKLPSRGECVRFARQWRSNRLYRPFLVCTDGKSCYAVIVRGAGLDGEARVLHLEDQLYRTDLEVLESIRHRGRPEELVRRYDEEFFPYERVRDERTGHKRHIRLSGDLTTNLIERLQGMLRERDKVLRGLKKDESPIIKMMQAYYNFIRNHQTRGKTPAEAAGIGVGSGKHAWLQIMIRATTRKLIEEERRLP